jgi:sugar lactone lactonase YvrE
MKKIYIRHLLLLLGLAYFVPQPAGGQDAAGGQDLSTVASAKVDTLKPPLVVYLSDMPAARIIPVPKVAGSSYTIQYKSGPKKIDLRPAEVVPLPVVSRSVADGNALPDQSASGLGLFTTYDTDKGLALDAVGYGKSILCDSRGSLWFGTQGGGVSKYDGKSFTTFTTAQGLANNIVRSIAEDKNGNLWFGTDGGVSKYDGKSFTTFTTAQGLANNSVRSIAEDKNGNLWFGTDGGVSKYDGKSFTTFTTAQGLANNSVRSIAEDKNGNLWFGTYGGVSKYDGKSFTTFTTAQGLANNSVFSIAEDKNGNLWFGTYREVAYRNMTGNPLPLLPPPRGLPTTL